MTESFRQLGKNLFKPLNNENSFVIAVANDDEVYVERRSIKKERGKKAVPKV